MQRGLPWASSSSSRQREPGGNNQPPPALWMTFGEPLLWSHTMEFAGESKGPSYRNLTTMDKGEGAYLGQPSSYLRAQVVIPTSGFAHQHNQVGSTLWPENWARCRCASSGSSNEEFASPKVTCHPSKVLSQSPTCYGEWLPAPLDQKALWQPLEAVRPVALKPRGGQAEFIAPEQSQYQAWSLPLLTTSRRIHS